VTKGGGEAWYREEEGRLRGKVEREVEREGDARR